MKKLVLLAILAAIINSVIAQTEHPNPQSPFIRSHVTFNLPHGFTKGAAEPISGPLKADSRIGFVYHANLNYTANFSDKIGATIGAGLGAFPFNFEFRQLDLGRNQYFDDVAYNFFASFRGELNLRQKLSSKYYLNGYAGASAISLQEYDMGSGASTSAQPGYLYQVRILYEKGWKPLAHIGTGISKVLPNQDLLTFRIDYNHSFKEFYNGTYSIMPNTPEASRGRFFNRGHHVNLGLAYTFSRSEKDEKLQRYIKEGAGNNANKIYKKEKRLINENTTMIAATGGLTFQMSRVKDPNNIFQDAANPNLMPCFSLEHNLKNNFYGESGFGFQEYFDVTKFKEGYGTGSNVFIAYQLSMGGGKRLIGKKNNYNYLNLTAGLVINFIDRETGYAGSSSGGMGNENGDTIIHYQFEHFTVNRVTPLLYIGASKDFRISGGFYLTMLYRYHQGLMNIYEERGSYISQWTSGPQKAKIALNGSFHTFQLGVKFNMGNLPERKLQQKRAPFAKGTTIISVRPGFIFYPEKTTYQFSHGQGNYKNKHIAFAPAIGIEHYLSDKYALEARMNFHKLHTFSMSMDIINLSLGAARKIELTNGFNLLNVHAGFAISKVMGTSGINSSHKAFNYDMEWEDHQYRSFDPATKKGKEDYYAISGNDTLYANNTELGIERTLFPAIYCGLSKDFSISSRASIGISYFRKIGLTTFYKEETKSFDNIIGVPGSKMTTMTGTASQLLFSLKFRIN
ncbi:MAG: hypothetical protein H0X62_08390 [Bacteroidetes bacterium]|nr:hypothetical protein [Bacteroidota bacterium]